ncbi:hypothetical protein cyc_05629 [Cyclospora cayetanensis]|uniref:Uncharacterized protein n=1 Tax=Cyclospora cayetanensis TaxID=88456 RepID=A0A1D3CX53_9EIME|nr:hypothetical protein cyc_05629 [Cyclospora cayetanensis]
MQQSADEASSLQSSMEGPSRRYLGSVLHRQERRTASGGTPADSGSRSLSDIWTGAASWLGASLSEGHLGTSAGSFARGSASLTPEGGLGIRWFVSGWRRGSVPSNKFTVQPFAVAQQATLVDPKSCPFCAERRAAVRFLREEATRLTEELRELTDATHPSLRESLQAYQEQDPASEGVSCGANPQQWDVDELLPGSSVTWGVQGEKKSEKTASVKSSGAVLRRGQVRGGASVGPLSSAGVAPARAASGVYREEGASWLAGGGRFLSVSSHGASMSDALEGSVSSAAAAAPAVGSVALGKEVLCRECESTAAAVSTWRQEVALRDKRCLLAIAFNAQCADEVEALLVSSYETRTSSSQGSCTSNKASAAENHEENLIFCESEAPPEHEPAALLLTGGPLLAMGRDSSQWVIVCDILLKIVRPITRRSERVVLHRLIVITELATPSACRNSFSRGLPCEKAQAALAAAPVATRGISGIPCAKSSSRDALEGAPYR